MDFLTAVVIGIHMASVHAPEMPNQNNTNVGIYMRADVNDATYQVGYYRNTIRRDTLYAGREFELAPKLGLFLGGATGYQKRCTRTPKGFDTQVHCEGFSRGAVTPTASLSYELPAVLTIKPRITFVANFWRDNSNVFHLSMEKAL